MHLSNPSAVRSHCPLTSPPHSLVRLIVGPQSGHYPDIVPPGAKFQPEYGSDAYQIPTSDSISSSASHQTDWYTMLCLLYLHSRSRNRCIFFHFATTHAIGSLKQNTLTAFQLWLTVLRVHGVLSPCSGQPSSGTILTGATMKSIGQS